MKVCRSLTWTVLLFALLLAGCGGREMGSGSPAVNTSAGSASSSQEMAINASGSPAGNSKVAAKLVAAIPRKIIYTAEVTLVSETLSTAMLRKRK